MPPWIWIFHVALLIITLFSVVKETKFKYLNKIIWIIIIIIVPLLGPILYWILEKKIFG
jgi:hypothetical protein